MYSLCDELILMAAGGYLARPPADRKLRTIRPFSACDGDGDVYGDILIFIARVTLITRYDTVQY